MNLQQVQALSSEHEQLVARVEHAQRAASRNLGLGILGTIVAAGGGAYFGWWWRKRKSCGCTIKPLDAKPAGQGPGNGGNGKNGNGNGKNGNGNGKHVAPPGGMVPGDS